MAKWKDLSMSQKGEVIGMAVKAGITDLPTIRETYNKYADGGNIHPLYNSKDIKVEHKPTPNSYWDNYDINAAINADVTPDYRGHYSDRFKRDIHPTSPMRGKFMPNNTFEVTDYGMNGPRGVNNTLFGIYEQGDGNVTPVYKGGTLLPEITVTPNGNYIHDTYDNNIITFPRKYDDGGIKDSMSKIGRKMIRNHPKTLQKGVALMDIVTKPIMNEIRQRLYDNMDSHSYENGLERFINTAIFNESEDPRHMLEDDDLKATYFQIPKEKRHNFGLFEPMKYTLSEQTQYKPKGVDLQKDIYKIDFGLVDTEHNRDEILRHAGIKPYWSMPLGYGENKLAIKPYDYTTSLDYALGMYTVGRDYDFKGDYISYFDSWDLKNPLDDDGSDSAIIYGPYQDGSFGIGKPFNIYDRIYLDDYYNIPDDKRGGFYLPELEVTPYGNTIANEASNSYLMLKAGGKLLLGKTGGGHKYDGKGKTSFLNRVTNAILSAGQAENPLMASTTGYKINESGMLMLDPEMSNFSQQFYNEYTNPTEPAFAALKLAAQVVDPTGITSYPDVHKAYTDLKNGEGSVWNLAGQVVGALPILHTGISLIKPITKFEKFWRGLHKVNKALDKFTINGDKVARASKPLMDKLGTKIGYENAIRVGDATNFLNNVSDVLYGVGDLYHSFGTNNPYYNPDSDTYGPVILPEVTVTPDNDTPSSISRRQEEEMIMGDRYVEDTPITAPIDSVYGPVNLPELSVTAPYYFPMPTAPDSSVYPKPLVRDKIHDYTPNAEEKSVKAKKKK